jgi:phosphopantothenoylcysteine decarboxylase/phosphopantothenate--cysteine ligase
MGIALANAAEEYGAEVFLVLGPVNIKPSGESIIVTNVTNSQAMADECFARFPSCHVAILSAAVADYTPEVVSDRKIKKKGDDSLVIRLKPTTDIAAQLGREKKPSQLVAGFALETDNGIEYARQKLISKNLDLIILNTQGEEGSGFGYDTNRITIIDKNNNIDKFELKSKELAARDILDKIVLMLKDLS